MLELNDKKALYVVFEGMDASGKSTQARMLADFLSSQGFSVFFFAEPTGGVVGRFLKERMLKSKNYAPETIALCFAADRVIFRDEKLMEALKTHDVVVADRSYYSSLVYQTVMGLDYHWVKEINRFAIKPDIAFVLDIPLEEYVRRKGTTEIIFENEAFQKKVRDMYLKLPELLPHDNIIILDGTRPKENLHEEIRKKIVALI